MKAPSNGFVSSSGEGESKAMNSELWHACAGPLVSLPPVGSLVVYFPQGHSEQVAASMQKQTDGVPSYPNLPSKLICMLHNVTLHADPETDEVYAQMTLQPVSKYDQQALLMSDMGLKQNKQPSEFFCKTLTASDTSTHGGFSVPRRAAEKIFPPLDFSMQPPCQELVARDLHDQSWTFRHIYRGQPKRYLLTTGWSIFVSSKRLIAGDSILFIRDDKSHLLLGIRRANRQQPALSSSVISSDSMHIGLLAAAAHAAANNSPFTIFYNPRASPSEFVVPLAKYNKAMYTQLSPGMRFRMTFETEDCGVRRYMGTVTGISDLDPLRWKNSQWRNLQVGWDESSAGERPDRISMWEIEPILTPFYICPPPFFRPKFPKQEGFPDDESDLENVFKRGMPWLGNDFGMKDASSSTFPGMSLAQWMSVQQNPQLAGAPSGLLPNGFQSNLGSNDNSKLLSFQSTAANASGLQFGKENQASQLQQPSLSWPHQQQLQQLLQSTVSSQQQQQQQQQIQQLLQSTSNSQQHLTLQQQQQQQQQLQQLLQSTSNSQQKHLPLQQQQQQQQQLQQLFQSTLNSQQQALPLQQQQHQQQQLRQQSQQLQQQQQQMMQSSSVNNDLVSSQMQNQNLQQQMNFSQLQHQQQLTGNTQAQQNGSAARNSYSLTSLPQDVQFQQQIVHTSNSPKPQQQAHLPQDPLQLMQRSQGQQSVPQNLQEQKLQLQLLQKLQQQRQKQASAPLSSCMDTQIPQPQQTRGGNLHAPQLQFSEKQMSGNSFTSSTVLQSPQLAVSQLQLQPNKSGPTDGDAPSCSTSPSTNNCQVFPSTVISKNQQGRSTIMEDSAFNAAPPLAKGQQRSADFEMKYVPNSRGAEQPKYKGSSTDRLDRTSSATSHCMESSGLQHSFSLPSFCMDADIQSNSKNTLSFTANVDGLTPDALLSRGYDSGKDIQNLLSDYGSTQRDIETELSSAAFGMPDISFNAGCSNDVAVNDAGVHNNGSWPNQAPRLRTYTKVQKRGSVGRTIDVTRYKGYEELRHDLARMFGIEGQLEDSQRTEWKLVYVDHENDILLVGDDPWEEFVSCVQSVKILSAAEVNQMSLDGDLGGQIPPPNQASSGNSSDNIW